MELTDKQKKWIITNFKNTKNDEIMLKIGIKHSALHRFASENGLKKTKQFQRKCQTEATEFARLANKRNNWPPKGYQIPNKYESCFKPGETNLMRLGAKKERERIENLTTALRSMRASEKRRVLFGLPQRTKLKVVAAPQVKNTYRHLLKKTWIYLVKRLPRSILYRNNQPKRSHGIKS